MKDELFDRSKTEEELRGMNAEQLSSRLRDVNETLAKLRRMRKAGYANPRVQSSIKREKKMIQKIQREG